MGVLKNQRKMKPEVEKLVFTELESESDSMSIAFVAESPIATYYIDFYKEEKTCRSYSSNAVIGEDKTLIKAIQRSNEFHKSNVLNCLTWE